MAIMMLFTLIVPPAMSLAEAARSNVKPFADEKSGGIVVNSSGDEQWIYLQAGETFESGFADGFTLTADSDVWISAETGVQDGQINFADLMNFEPDSVETVYDENGNSYTVRTYSSQSTVSSITAAFAEFNDDVADAADGRYSSLKTYSDDELVDIIVVLDGKSVFELCGVELGGLTRAALNASEKLHAQHTKLASQISNVSASFNMKYDFTLLLNGFGAQVRYGEIKAINDIPGVKYAFVSPSFNVSDDEIEVLSSDDYGTIGIIAGNGCDPKMQNANSDMNTEAAWLAGYTGEGMTVAVIDTGIDLTHAMFSVQPENPSMTAESIAEIMTGSNMHASQIVEGVTAEQLYSSAKIPFEFDYADGDADATDTRGHGSHVAGIIAGATTANLINTYNIQNVGVAPDAQLVVMKVFDTNGAASMIDVTAALEDAILLGVDAANLSLGTSCGSVTGYPEITAVFNAALEAGINVAVAAGNDTNSTYTSLWNNDLGLASNPDIGVLSMPATFDAPMSVASADNSTYLSGFASSLDYFTFHVGANNYKYQFSDKSPYAYRFGAQLGGDWEYVSLETGAEADYEGIDVSGKLVLAKLSTELTINEQGRIAQSHGAVGLILYPATNAAGNFTIPDTTHDEYTIPTVGMAYFYGNNLANNIIPDTLHVQAYWVTRPDGNQISAFSSWGATNELTLKPDITAIGGSVVSAYKNGSIAISSGTSMASPAIAGISVLVRQYLQETTDLSGKELAVTVDKLLMSSAKPITDADSGLPFSPRVQGAGLVDAGKAISVGAYIDVAGTDKAKFELGDDRERTGVYTMTFDVVNMTGETKVYDLSVIAMTESAVCGRVNPDHTYEYLMEQFEYELEAIIDAPKTVTVDANSSSSVTVTVTLSSRDIRYIERYFENGIYIEGFITLDEVGGESISAPYLAFYGDWRDAPAIETNFFYDWPSEDYPANTTLIANTVYTYDEINNETWFIGDTRSGNGQTPYGIQIGSKMMYWDERNAISPNGDGIRDFLEVVTGLYRNVKEYRYIITDRETGEELYRKDMGYVPKTYYSSNYNDVVSAGMYSGHELDFDWTTLENNQTVIVRIEAVVDIEDNERIDSWEFPVTCDTEAPVTAVRLYVSGTRYYVQNQINENRFVDYTEIFANLNTGSYAKFKVAYGGYNPAGRRENVTLGFSNAATDFVSKTMDYAGNYNYVYVSMDNKEDMVELDREEATLIVGDQLTINQLYEFDTSYTDTEILCPLTWASSDSSIVSITESDDHHAVITANAAGTATITATNTFNISDSVEITVVEADDDNYAVVIFDAGEYGTINGTARLVLEKGTVLTDSDIPEVTPDNDHLFWGFDKVVSGHRVTEDVTFTAKYRRNIPVGKTYIETNTIVPGEAYLIAADYNGGTYIMNNQAHIGGEVGLNGQQVQLNTVNGAAAIVNDGLANFEWSFSAENAQTITHIASGKLLSTVYSQGYAWLGLRTETDVVWTWDNNGGLSHNDAGANGYDYLSYGISASGFSAGFDIFERADSAYTPIRLFKHTENEDVNTYTVTFVDGLTGEIIDTVTVNECENAVLPEAPVHDGYTFVRYDDNGEFITDDITITAEYSVNSYLVTFVDGLDNAVLSEQIVEYGSAAAAPEAPEHEGYTFTGWDNEFESVEGNLTITAEYVRNEYTVTFLDWNGAALGTVTVLHGENAELIPDPERTGYTFIGWDADLDNITSDVTTTALYEINYYLVAFVDWDGSMISRQLVAYGQAAELPEEPQREYYNFIGWSADTSCITEETIVVAQYSIAIAIGDVNTDGSVNIADALIALRIAMGLETPSEIQLIAADINEDMCVNAVDAQLILRVIIAG